MQYKLCKTVEEANEHLKKFQECNQREEVGFCPLINHMCNDKCTCFRKPKKVKDGDKYRVYGARCGNGMFARSSSQV